MRNFLVDKLVRDMKVKVWAETRFGGSKRYINTAAKVQTLQYGIYFVSFPDNGGGEVMEYRKADRAFYPLD